LTIAAPHFGHHGPAGASATPDAAVGTGAAAVETLGADLVDPIISDNASPSMSRIFAVLANSLASFVKVPLVTMTPPSARRAATTPLSSRTTDTRTCFAFQCLHWIKTRRFALVAIRSI